MPDRSNTEVARIRRDARRFASTRNHDDLAATAYRRLTGSKIPLRLANAKPATRLMYLAILREVVEGQIAVLRDEVKKNAPATGTLRRLEQLKELVSQ